MENARIDKDSTKLSTLKQLIRILKEEVVSVQHDHPVIVHQAPRVQFVQRQLEPLVKVLLMLVWIVQVFHSYYFDTIFLFTIQ